MMTLFQFIFGSAWHFFGIVFVLITIEFMLVSIWKHFLRFLTIRKHGYPPPHCNAGGNIVEMEE